MTVKAGDCVNEKGERVVDERGSYRSPLMSPID